MKARIIINSSFVFWTICLIVMICTNNPYLNVFIFFLGFLLTICGLAYGCDTMEKQNKPENK